MIEPETIEFVIKPGTWRGELFDASIDGRSGVYACFSMGGECFYVGRSKNLLSRIWGHWASDMKGVRRWWLCGAADLAKYGGKAFAPDTWILRVWVSDDFHKLELEQIVKLNPSHNSKYYDYNRLLAGMQL